MDLDLIVDTDVKNLIQYAESILDCYDEIINYYPMDQNLDDSEKLDNLLDELNKLIDEEDNYYESVFKKQNNVIYKIKFVLHLNNLIKTNDDNKYYLRVLNYININNNKRYPKLHLQNILEMDYYNLIIDYLTDYENIPNIKLTKFSILYQNKLLEKKYLNSDFSFNDIIILEYKYYLKQFCNDINYENQLQNVLVTECENMFFKYIKTNDFNEKSIYLCILKSKLILLNQNGLETLKKEINELNLGKKYESELNALIADINYEKQGVYYLDSIKYKKK